jgi:hypothetical protein
MQFPSEIARRVMLCAVVCAALGAADTKSSSAAQQPDGPQKDAPEPVAPTPAAARAPGKKLVVPAGTRLAVVLENGVSTRSAKVGDSLYFHTAFPVTENNQVVIPVGSYLRGSLLESKRPGRL